MEPLLEGQGRAGERLGDVGMARCHHHCRASWQQDKDCGWSMSTVAAPHPAHLHTRRQLLKAGNKNAHKQPAQALLLRPLAKELIPTLSSNLKTTVSPRSSCQNLQVPPQLP